MVYCEVKHKHRHGREQDQYTIFAPFANEQRQFTISNTIVKSKPCCKKTKFRECERNRISCISVYDISIKHEYHNTHKLTTFFEYESSRVTFIHFDLIILYFLNISN